MTRTIVALTAILVLEVSSASDAQRDTPKTVGAGAVIQGRIIAADTRAPLQDVTVSLRSADQLPTSRPFGGLEVLSHAATATARPDSDGQFELVGIAPGRYRLAADPGPTAIRYLPVRFPDPAIDDSEPLTVSKNQVLPELLITLPRAAVINGHVFDETGNPMALVSVSAQEVLPGDRRRVAVGALPGSSARTDDNGAFRLFGLRPGEYVLSAQTLRLPPILMDQGKPSTAGLPPPSYYPGTASARDATRIRVAAGEEHGPLIFALNAVRGSTLRGLVLDSNGHPAPTVSVSLRSTSVSGVGGMNVSGFSRTTNSDGTVEFTGVPRGDYAASVSHYGAPGPQFGWVPVVVADDVAGMTIRLQPGVSVKGRLVFEGQAPTPLPTMYVRSVPARAGGGTASGVMPEPDLSFALSDQFGPTFVRTEGPPGWHLKAVLLGGADITEQAVEFAVGAPLLEVVLSQAGAALAGIVTTATGVAAESSVMLISEDPASWHERATTTRTTVTSSNGKYRFEGLRAGRYLIVATPREDGVVTGTPPEYFELLSKHSTRMLIGDGESKKLDLKRVTLR